MTLHILNVTDAWSGFTPTTRGELIRLAVLPPDAPILTPSERRRDVAMGRLTRTRRGGYVEPAPEPDPYRSLTLARLASLRSTLSEPFVVIGSTAAVLLGLWHAVDDGLVHIAVNGHPSGESRSDPWLVRHQITIPPEQIRHHEGLLVTSMERTAVDCARSLPVRLSLQTVDAAITVGAETEEMNRILDGMVGYRGVRDARKAVGWGRVSGSPFESTQRAEIVIEGLPMPETLVKLTLVDGETVELDMGWRELRLGIEAHGDAKYQRGADASEEPLRVFRARARGWSLVDVRTREAREVRMARIARAFKDAWLDRYGRPWRPA